MSRQIRTHYAINIVVGYRGPVQNHIILGNSYSYTESIDIFSQSEDLVLMNILYGSTSSLRIRTDVYGCFYGL